MKMTSQFESSSSFFSDSYEMASIDYLGIEHTLLNFTTVMKAEKRLYALGEKRQRALSTPAEEACGEEENGG